MTGRNYYQVIGVTTDADLATIKRAFNKKALDMRADVNDTPEVRELIAAWEVLRDPEKREAYDKYGTADPMESEHNKLFSKMFEQISNAFFESGVDDSVFCEFMAQQMRGAFTTLISEQEKVLHKNERLVGKLKKSRDTFQRKTKGKTNAATELILMNLEHRIEAAVAQVQGVTRDLDISKKAYTTFLMFEGMVPDPSAWQQSAPTTNFFRTTNPWGTRFA